MKCSKVENKNKIKRKHTDIEICIIIWPGIGKGIQFFLLYNNDLYSKMYFSSVRYKYVCLLIYQIINYSYINIHLFYMKV